MACVCSTRPCACWLNNSPHPCKKPRRTIPPGFFFICPAADLGAAGCFLPRPGFSGWGRVSMSRRAVRLSAPDRLARYSTWANRSSAWQSCMFSWIASASFSWLSFMRSKSSYRAWTARGVVPSLPGKLRTGGKQPSHVLQRQTLLEGLDQGDHQQMLGGILLPHRLLQQPGLGIVVDDGLGDGFLPGCRAPD